MNKFKLIFVRACKLFHVNKIAFKLFRRHHFIADYSVKQAREKIEAISPKPENSSCIGCNGINKLVDLHIIVPVYNQEQYIEACIDSIIKNMKKYSYRVTIINDGSTDKTKTILEEKYAENEYIEIIHQGNRGFSGSRNRGLKNIKGKYVAFVDSDDMAGNIETMLDKAFETNVDVVRGSYATIDERGVLLKECKTAEGNLSPMEGSMGTPWGKIYRAECLKDVQFPENYWYEDTICEGFWPKKVHNAFGISDVVYFYRKNSKGISASSMGKRKSVDTYWVMEQIFNDREKLGIQPTQEDYEFVLRMVKLSYSRIKYLTRDIREAVFVLFSAFLDERFPLYCTTNTGFIVLEKALRERDYGYYCSFCELM